MCDYSTWIQGAQAYSFHAFIVAMSLPHCATRKCDSTQVLIQAYRTISFLCHHEFDFELPAVQYLESEDVELAATRTCLTVLP